MKHLLYDDILREKSWDDATDKGCSIGWLYHFASEHRNPSDTVGVAYAKLHAAMRNKIGNQNIVAWNDSQQTSRELIAETLNEVFEEYSERCMVTV